MLAFELANVCLMKMRHHPDQQENLIAAFGLLARMDIETAAIDQAEVIALGKKTGLTAYDAGYLWLARRLDCELVTLDRRLQSTLTSAG